MFSVVLVHPEIPPNTGNVIRLCANTGCRLHLVEPLGFSLDDKQLQRAGLDYHEYAGLRTHADWAACVAALRGETPQANWYAFSTRGGLRPDRVRFHPGDVLVFGAESRGLPPAVLADFTEAQRLRLPMLPGQRSLNLSNAAAVAVFEGWRQNGFAGAA